MNVGEKIKNAREDMDLSQADVAREIPMSQSGYSKIERGAQEPNLNQLRRICEILNIDPAYLLSLNVTDTKEKDLKFAKAMKEIYKKIYN